MASNELQGEGGWLKSFWTPVIIAIIGAAAAAVGNVIVTYKAGQNAIDLEERKDTIARASQDRADLSKAVAVLTEALSTASFFEFRFLYDVKSGSANRDAAYKEYSEQTKNALAKVVAAHIDLARVNPQYFQSFALVVNEVILVDTAISEAPNRFAFDAAAAGQFYSDLSNLFIVSRSLLGPRVTNILAGKHPDSGKGADEIPRYDLFLQGRKNPLITPRIGPVTDALRPKR